MNLTASAGLSLDQAPPLRLVMAFFLMAPVALFTAGGLLIGTPHALFLSPAIPLTVALTHLGTLGFLATVMIGATYQLCPVLGGVRVPRVGLAYLVFAGLGVGLVTLIWGLIFGSTVAVKVSMYTLPLAFLLFLVPASLALLRARPINTIKGMRVSLACVAVAAVLGAWLSLGYTGTSVPETRGLWLKVHLSLGILGWVGGLLMSVSWQLVPMFYLTPTMNQKVTIRSLWVLGLSLFFTVLVLPLEGLVTADLNGIAFLTILPGAAVIWVVHPISVLHAIRNRRRRRVDPSKDYWVVAMCTAPIILMCAGLALWSTDPRWGLTCGWLVVMGWAGLVLHGMLTRIIPFLVWFHRFSHRVGEVGVPSVRQLYPAPIARREFWLHETCVASGLCAIWLQNAYLSQIVGLLLVLTGVTMLRSMLKALLWKVPTSAPEVAAVASADGH